MCRHLNTTVLLCTTTSCLYTLPPALSSFAQKKKKSSMASLSTFSLHTVFQACPGPSLPLNAGKMGMRSHSIQSHNGAASTYCQLAPWIHSTPFFLFWRRGKVAKRRSRKIHFRKKKKSRTARSWDGWPFSDVHSPTPIEDARSGRATWLFS